MAQKFVCWGDGIELTAGVHEALRGAPHGPVVLRQGKEQSAGDWRIVILCPKDKVENLFSSAVANKQLTSATIVGAPPSAGDTYLTEAAKEIAPAKSLARSGDSAKFTIERISLVALVLGGFGIFTDLGGGFSAHPNLFAAVVMTAAAALAMAVWALMPRREENVNYNNLFEVQTAYASAINHRVRWAQLASLTLLVALGLALWAFFEAGGKEPDAAITTSWDGSGDRPVLSFAVEMKDLPGSATPRVILIGLEEPGAAEGEELSAVDVDRSRLGTAKVEQKLVPPEGFAAYRLEARLIWEDGERVEVAEFVPPPFEPVEAPPAKGRATTSAGEEGS